MRPSRDFAPLSCKPHLALWFELNLSYQLRLLRHRSEDEDYLYSDDYVVADNKHTRTKSNNYNPKLPHRKALKKLKASRTKKNNYNLQLP